MIIIWKRNQIKFSSNLLKLPTNKSNNFLFSLSATKSIKYFISTKLQQKVNNNKLSINKVKIKCKQSNYSFPSLNMSCRIRNSNYVSIEEGKLQSWLHYCVFNLKFLPVEVERVQEWQLHNVDNQKIFHQQEFTTAASDLSGVNFNF